MLTTDLALRFDPIYSQIAKKFLEDPKEFEKAFARAWFKLTHRDMGPKECYLGPEVPAEEFVWQDPLPQPSYEPVTEEDIYYLKEKIRDKIRTSEMNGADLLYTAISSALTFRNSDRRGGTNGARIRLNPMKNWEIHHPDRLAKVFSQLEALKREFEEKAAPRGISLADLVVLAGNVALEEVLKASGYPIEVPFVPGRKDALQEQVEVPFYEALEPVVCPFRNYIKDPSLHRRKKLEEILVDRAQLLCLRVPELVCLYGGLRSLGLTYNFRPEGVLTHKPGLLSKDFFNNLLSMDTEWVPLDEYKVYFEGRDRTTGQKKWRATRLDLIFGHHEELRAVCEVYAEEGGEEKFIWDFVKVWTKLMHQDRFDLWRNNRKLYKALVSGC